MKRRKRNKRFMKMLLIYTSIVIFMDLVGVGYSQWSDNIHVESTLKTGSVKVDFGSGTTNGISMNMLNGISNRINTSINFDVGMFGEEYFEFINKGTLPVSINYDRFQPTQQVMAGETPLIATIILDPILNNCIEPGSTVHGRIHVEVPNEFVNTSMLFNGNNVLNGNGALISNIDTANIVYSNNGIPLNVVYNTITESQSITFQIPVGCGGWEELLQINAAVNVSRYVSSILPDTTGMNQNYLNYNDYAFDENNSYTYLPEGNTGYRYLPNGNTGNNIEDNGWNNDNNSDHIYMLGETEFINARNNK